MVLITTPAALAAGLDACRASSIVAILSTRYLYRSGLFPGDVSPAKYTSGISSGTPSSASMGLSTGTAPIVAGHVIPPWPRSRSTNSGAHCLRTA